MKNFRTFDSAVAFYRHACALSLKGALKEQLDRASSSIALNLAEGRGKPTVRDQVKFFSIALGSARECQAILILARQDESAAAKVLDTVAAQLYRLIQRAR